MKTKADIVAQIAEDLGMPKAQAERTVAHILDTLFDEAVQEGKVKFGTHRFKRVDKKATTAHNPQTGGTVDVPARIRVKYARTKGFYDTFDVEAA